MSAIAYLEWNSSKITGWDICHHAAWSNQLSILISFQELIESHNIPNWMKQLSNRFFLYKILFTRNIISLSEGTNFDNLRLNKKNK